MEYSLPLAKPLKEATDPLSLDVLYIIQKFTYSLKCFRSTE